MRKRDLDIELISLARADNGNLATLSKVSAPVYSLC